MNYKCEIIGGGAYRAYDVNTKSAVKCAEMFGRCDSGETVLVVRKNGSVISAAKWNEEDGRYIRVSY